LEENGYKRKERKLESGGGAQKACKEQHSTSQKKTGPHKQHKANQQSNTAT
jgi:hypothetical protein